MPRVPVSIEPPFPASAALDVTQTPAAEFDPAAARLHWAALKAARGQRIDMARSGAPAHIIGHPAADVQMACVAHIDAIRIRTIPAIRAAILRHLSDIGPDDMGGAA